MFLILIQDQKYYGGFKLSLFECKEGERTRLPLETFQVWGEDAVAEKIAEVEGILQSKVAVLDMRY